MVFTKKVITFKACEITGFADGILSLCGLAKIHKTTKETIKRNLLALNNERVTNQIRYNESRIKGGNSVKSPIKNMLTEKDCAAYINREVSQYDVSIKYGVSSATASRWFFEKGITSASRKKAKKKNDNSTTDGSSKLITQFLCKPWLKRSFYKNVDVNAASRSWQK